jgi:hypothetical protein
MPKLLFTLISILLYASLSGCTTYSYVESDIPGVAQWVGGGAIARNTARSCPHAAIAYGAYSETTTSVGLTRVRVESSFYCE